MGEYVICIRIIIYRIISQYVNVWWKTLQLISIGNICPSYPNSLVYFKYFLGCIVCISNGALNLIWFILAHVICIFETHIPPCLYALNDERKFIYLFYLVILYFYLVYSHLTYALLAWGRSRRTNVLRLSVLTGEHDNNSQIITKISSLFTQFMITNCFIKSFQHKHP